MFKFTMRELVMLTLIVGLALGLWIAQLQFLARQDSADGSDTATDSSPWQKRAAYWSGAAHAVRNRLMETGHSVDFIEGVGVKIDGKLILTSGQPETAQP